MKKMNNKKSVNTKNYFGKAVFAALFLCLSSQYASSICIGNVQVDPHTNDATITITNLPASQSEKNNDSGENSEIILNSQIYKQVTCKDGSSKWVKDNGSYADSKFHAINAKENYIKLNWVCGDPENLSSDFLIELTDENKNKITRAFKVSNPNM